MRFQSLTTTLVASVLGASVLVSQAVAGDVSQDMFVLAGNVGVVLDATNKQEMIEALDTMKKASVDAQHSVPSTLKAGTKEYKGYQQGFQVFIDTIDSIREKAENGQLDVARKEAEKLVELRNKYHALYR